MAKKKKSAKVKSAHKPLKLLIKFRDKMPGNMKKLDALIAKRRAAGER